MKRVIILFVIGLSIVVMAFNQCNISTANITDVKMCDNITDYQCEADNPVFSPSTPVIFITCILRNAPDGTIINFAWYYVEEGQKILIDEVSLESEGSTTPMYSNFTAPDNGWPTGNYEVVLSLNTDNSEPITKTFTVH